MSDQFYKSGGDSFPHLLLSLLHAEDAAFVLVSPEKNIISSSEGGRRLLSESPLRPIGQALSERASKAVSLVLESGGQTSVPETIDGRSYQLEIYAVPAGALLYFRPAESSGTGLGLQTKLSYEVTDSLSLILISAHLARQAQGEKLDDLLGKIRECSLRIYRSVLHARELFAPVLEESLSLSVYDMTQLCQTLAAACRARSGGVEVSVDAPADCPAVFDKRQISTALLNLLTNAVSAQEVSHVRVTVQAMPGRVSVSVADDGRGLPAEALDQLYSSWERPSDESLLPEQNASGLLPGFGLPLVRRIAGLHGGVLLMEPNQPRGTIFRLVIPSDPSNAPIQLSEPALDDGIDYIELELSVL